MSEHFCAPPVYMNAKNDVLNVGLSIPEVWCLGLLWLLLSSSGGLESLWHLYLWWGGLQLEKTFWEVIFTLWRQSLSSEFMELFGSLSLNLFVPKPAGAVCKLFSSTPHKISSVDKRFLYGVKFLVLVFYFFSSLYQLHDSYEWDTFIWLPWCGLFTPSVLSYSQEFRAQAEQRSWSVPGTLLEPDYTLISIP